MLPILTAFGTDRMKNFLNSLRVSRIWYPSFIKYFLSDGNHQRCKILACRNTQILISINHLEKNTADILLLCNVIRNTASIVNVTGRIGLKFGGGEGEERCKRVTCWSGRIVATRPWKALVSRTDHNFGGGIRGRFHSTVLAFTWRHQRSPLYKSIMTSGNVTQFVIAFSLDNHQPRVLWIQQPI